MSRSHLLLVLTRILLILPLLVSFPVKAGLPNGSVKAVDDSGQGFTTHKNKAFTTGNVLANDIDSNGDHLFVKSFDASSAVGLVSFGSLDSGFGVGGKVTTDFGGTSSGLAAAIQPNGKIVLVGGAEYNGEHLCAMVRYNPDGSLDTSFNGSGKLNTCFIGGGFWDAVTIQKDDKIVVAGIVGDSRDVALARVNPDGSPDASFGGLGIVTTDFGAIDYGRDVVIQPDGKIVVAGETFIVNGFQADHPLPSSPQYKIIVARYNPDGSLDASFNGDGKVTLGSDISYLYNAAKGVVLQSDGKIVLGGYFEGDIAVVRLNQNGSLDTDFNKSGIGDTNFRKTPFSDESDVTLQPDGKIVVVGQTGDYLYCNFAMARYNTDGSLDVSFNGNGKVTTDFGGDDKASSVLIQPDGKIVVAGSTGGLSDYNFMMARYNSDGSLDTSLDGDGFVITDFGGNDIASSIVLQPDGRLVIAGSTESDPKYQFALARYDVGGTFTYDPNGKFDGLAPGEHAFDTFTYVASDGVLTDTATVTITIQGGFQLWLPMISNY